jgi:hypothetical protein
MLDYQEEAKNAFMACNRADHLLTKTYPQINDPKLLLSVADALKDATINGIVAFLTFKEMNQMAKDLNVQVTLFKEHCVREFKLKEDIFPVLDALQNIDGARQVSPVEFRRKQKYVICSEDYNMNVLDERLMKKHLIIVRDFLKRLEVTINVR